MFNYLERQVLTEARAGIYTPPDYSILRWAAAHLADDGLLEETSPKGSYKLTDKGRAAAETL